jgi:hypothetical protein
MDVKLQYLKTSGSCFAVDLDLLLVGLVLIALGHEFDAGVGGLELGVDLLDYGAPGRGAVGKVVAHLERGLGLGAERRGYGQDEAERENLLHDTSVGTRGIA